MADRLPCVVRDARPLRPRDRRVGGDHQELQGIRWMGSTVAVR